MSLLTASDPFDLALRIEEMGTAALRRHAAEVAALLGHRDSLVRLYAARALGRAARGAAELRARLGEERDELVLAEISDSLSLLRDPESLPALRYLAEAHKSPIVRSYALMALADIASREALPYLEERYVKERSRSVRATLSAVRLALGSATALADVLKHLRSRDLRIRHLLANLLADYAPRKGRAALVEALREAAARESVEGVRTDLERAVEALSHP